MRKMLLIFPVLILFCATQERHFKYEKFLGEWKLVNAEPLQINYPELIFKNDSTASFTSRGDTIYWFMRYFLKSDSLILKDNEGKISKCKILKLDNDSLVFKTLLGHKKVQRYIKEVKK